MATIATPPSEVRLGACYGRYRDWQAPDRPSVDSAHCDASNASPLTSLSALIVQFEASTREDFRVGFAPSPSIDTNLTSKDKESRQLAPIEWKYEVAVGTSGNTELVWRKAASGQTKEIDLVRAFTGRTCSAQTFVPYWIVINNHHGLLSFGVGPTIGLDVLATCQDVEFHAVTHTAFTSWDAAVSFRNIQLRGISSNQIAPETNILAFPPPRVIVRADPLGTCNLLTPKQQQEAEAETATAQRRAERFQTPMAPLNLRKFMDPREIRKLQRTGAIAPGFATGIDVTSHEEEQKRLERMKRFDTPAFAVEYSAETAKALEKGWTQEAWTIKQQEDAKLQTRARKFGLNPASKNVEYDLTPVNAKVRSERCDVRARDDAVGFRDDALHLYSLDDEFQHVRTSDVMAYFLGYGPSYVEWLNDSSCTIVFQDAFTATRALLARGGAIPAQIIKQTKQKRPDEDVEMANGEAEDQEEEINGLDEAFNRSQWYQGQPIRRAAGSKTWRVLLRKATDDDFPPEKLPKQGLYHSRQTLHHEKRKTGRQERGHGTSLRRKTSSERRHQTHPYAKDRRHRKTKDSGKVSNRIRVNPDGSINIVREQGSTLSKEEHEPVKLEPM